MARGLAAGYGQKGYLGRILVALGLAALAADLAFLAAPLQHLVGRMTDGLLGVLPALGLSILNTVRAAALHQIDYFSIISRILILFLALAAIVVGAVLWKAGPSARAVLNRRGVPDSANGDL
ncbi:MAG: hypothetical protein WCE61_10120 [Candidatus Acidiferrum sp.]